MHAHRVLRKIHFSSSFFLVECILSTILLYYLSSFKTFFFKRQYFIKEFQKILSRDLSSPPCNPQWLILILLSSLPNFLGLNDCLWRSYPIPKINHTTLIEISTYIHVFLSIKHIPLSGNENTYFAHFRNTGKKERSSFPQKSPTPLPTLAIGLVWQFHVGCSICGLRTPCWKGLPLVCPKIAGSTFKGLATFFSFISMCEWRTNRRGSVEPEEKAIKHYWKISLQYILYQNKRKQNHQNYGKKYCNHRIFRKWSRLQNVR